MGEAQGWRGLLTALLVPLLLSYLHTAGCVLLQAFRKTIYDEKRDTHHYPPKNPKGASIVHMHGSPFLNLKFQTSKIHMELSSCVSPDQEPSEECQKHAFIGSHWRMGD